MPLLTTFGGGSAGGFGQRKGGGPKIFDALYLVIAGGAGGSVDGCGGGAGGYRNSNPGEASGANSSAESALSLETGVAYTVTVGAGGGGSYGDTTYGSAQEDSVFANISSAFGGNNNFSPNPLGKNGGSGGGAGYFSNSYGSGTANQGQPGSTPTDVSNPYQAGGGGGGAYSGASTKDGGNGLSSSITGSSVTRAGGGGGGGRNTVTAGNGGSGGGGAGTPQGIPGPTQIGQPGTTNTGSGAGAGGQGPSGPNLARPGGGNGGSGLVVIKVPDTITATFSPGVTSSTITSVPGFNIYSVTATSTGSETVTFE